ncbi:hypothetical protein O181_064960 [Austropuccinia psidii MF-1]|uniref:Uncharacterized protein n=1 Tax=Austropuccinia psidii MF-1 TaxID=1389203 RepID=A0A9Q3EU61_9BASI|nr:hypothetical protein [Austropuccinia psidii MF-1]
MGNFSKPVAGGNELLLIHKELSGSGEDHIALGIMESLFLKRQGQKDKKLVEEPKHFIHTPKEGTVNDPSFVERSTTSLNQLPKVSKTSPKNLRRDREVPGAIKSRTIGTDLTHKGTGFPNWNLHSWTVCSIWPDPLWIS